MTNQPTCVYNNENKDIKTLELGYKRMGEMGTMGKQTEDNIIPTNNTDSNELSPKTDIKSNAVSEDFITFNGTLLTTEKNPDAALYINSKSFNSINQEINKCNSEYNDDNDDIQQYEHML